MGSAGTFFGGWDASTRSDFMTSWEDQVDPPIFLRMVLKKSKIGIMKNIKIIQKIFKKKKAIIGAVHFPPLLGYDGFPGLRAALETASKDIGTLERGGVDGVIFENNYDIPHKEFIDSSAVASMSILGKVLRERTRLPLGVSVLWNDYRTAFALAKLLNLQFVRIPVFVDIVQTDFGMISGKAKEIMAYRKKISAEHVALFADIHVKHARLISKRNITLSARLAIKNGADAVIITGAWTGDAPDEVKLASVRAAIGSFPLIIGSGADKANIGKLFRYADATIVSTALKQGGKKAKERNVKAYSQRIDRKLVREFVAAAKKECT